MRIPLFLSLALAGFIFAVGYFLYFKRDRIDKVISHKPKIAWGVLFVVLAIAYVIVSIYFMFQAGNYVKDQVYN